MEELERLMEMGGWAIIGILFVAVIAGLIAFVIYIINSIGLYKLLKKNNEENAWVAFIPIARDYMLAKVAYEKYDNGKYDYLKYVVVILGLLSSLVINDDPNLETLGKIVGFAIWGIKVFAANKIFVKCNKNKIGGRTICYAIFGNIVFLILGDKIKAAKDLSKSEDYNEHSEEVKEVKDKVRKSGDKFCVHCGASLEKGSKFCGTCGKEVK